MAVDHTDSTDEALTLGVEALHPDALTGDISTEERQFDSTAGRRGFQVKEGVVTVWELRDPTTTRRAVNEHEIPAIIRALNPAERGGTPATPALRVVKVETEEGPRLRVQIEKEGKTLTYPDFVQKQTHEKIQAALRAAEKKEDFKRTWEVRKQALESLKEFDTVLEFTTTEAAVDEMVQRYTRQLRSGGLGATELGEVIAFFKEVSRTLEHMDEYDRNLAQDASTKGLDLRSGELKGLPLENPTAREKLKNGLDQLKLLYTTRLDELADVNRFETKWNTEWSRIWDDATVIADVCDMRRLKAKIQEDLISPLDAPGTHGAKIVESKEQLQEVRADLEKVEAFYNSLQEDAERSGIDPNHPVLLSFKDEFDSPERAAFIAELKALVAELEVYEDYEKQLSSKLDEVTDELEVPDTVNVNMGKMIVNDTATPDPAEEDTMYFIQSTASIPVRDSDPTVKLEAHHRTLEMDINILSSYKTSYEAYKKVLEETPIPDGIYNKGAREKERARILGEVSSHIQKIEEAESTGTAAVKKIEEVLARRGEAINRAKKHRAPQPKGRVRRAAEAVAGTVKGVVVTPFKGVSTAIASEKKEREEEESAQHVERPLGQISIGENANKKSLLFGQDGAIFEWGVENTTPPQEGWIEVPRSPAAYQAVVDELNADKRKPPEVRYRVNTTGPTPDETYIEKVTGTGVARTGLRAQAGDVVNGLAKQHNEQGYYGAVARHRRKLESEAKTAEKEARRARQEIIDETKLMPILEELRKEGKPEEEARRLTRSLLSAEKSMREAESDAIFDQAWKTIIDKENSRWTKAKGWVVAVPGKVKNWWERGAQGRKEAASTTWEATKKSGEWLYEHAPSGETVLKTGAAVVGGVAVGVGLLGLGGMYVSVNVLRGTLAYLGAAGHQLLEKGEKLAGTAKNTAVNLVKAPFRMVGSPLVGAYHGLKNGWNYPKPAKKRKLTGWTAPFKWMRNVASAAWRNVKAAPTALAAATLGLVLGGAYQGPVDALAPVIGINATAPVPGFMLPQESKPTTIEVEEKATPTKAPAAAGHGAHH